MSTPIHKEYIGDKPVWPGRICFIVLSSGLGGTETLAIRQSRWLRRNNVHTAIITRFGVMDGEYQESFDQVLHLDDDEVDPGSLLMDEWYRLLDRLADGLRPEGGWHFMVFGQDGVFISSELSARIAGSSCSIYLVDDLRYGPTRLEYIEAMSRHGLFFSMNEACLEAHRRNYGYRLENATVIPLPMSVTSEQKPLKTGSRLRVVTVARLVPMKGYVEGLILAVSQAVREDGSDVELVIVGAGSLLSQVDGTKGGHRPAGNFHRFGRLRRPTAILPRSGYLRRDGDDRTGGRLPWRPCLDCRSLHCRIQDAWVILRVARIRAWRANRRRD